MIKLLLAATLSLILSGQAFAQAAAPAPNAATAPQLTNGDGAAIATTSEAGAVSTGAITAVAIGAGVAAIATVAGASSGGGHNNPGNDGTGGTGGTGGTSGTSGTSGTN